MEQTSYKRRVAILRGGPSSEYDISMQTGAGVLKALLDTPTTTKDIVISKNGEWILHGFVKSPEQLLSDVDVVFIALHGSYGEDGTVQRILERLALPYTGSGSYASAIAMNKVLTKEHLKKHSDTILMAPHMKLSRDGVANLVQTVASITALFGPEYVIKPISGGSSIGTVMCDQSTLYRTLAVALENYDEVIVEKRIHGKEATVGILEGFRDQEHYQLPAIEIVPPARTSFFSEDVKYTGETEEICPGRFSQSEKDTLLAVAKEVHTALGLKQYSRSDFMVAQEQPGQKAGVYFLEVNTLPGLTSQSLFPKSVEAVGSSYKELVLHLLDTARR
jgi:D-alanine-D-alanine ligase